VTSAVHPDGLACHEVRFEAKEHALAISISRPIAANGRRRFDGRCFSDVLPVGGRIGPGAMAFTKMSEDASRGRRFSQPMTAFGYVVGEISGTGDDRLPRPNEVS
jgi:hypothetical protein